MAAVTAVIATMRPDILLLTGVDYDAGLAALTALAGRIGAAGMDYPHVFARRPNTGMASGLDLDGDGRRGGFGDAQGFGRFAGEGGMAILSRWPVAGNAVRDFSGFLWRDLPGALLPEGPSGPFPSAEALAVQRLSTTGHWSVPVVLPDGERLTLLAWHASPPVFDGPEDRNGRRNHDEAAFWTALIDGRIAGEAPPSAPFVVLGDGNLDPVDGEGRPDAIRALLAHPAVQDPQPASGGGTAAARAQGGPNAAQAGDPARDTADWAEDRGPGNLRVDLVLPSAGLRVLGAGVVWPAPGDALHAEVEAASRHRLVWVDVAMP